MKRFLYAILLLAIGLVAARAARTYKPETVRQPAEYLSIVRNEVQDTCPGQDPINRFTCTQHQHPGYTCFDVYQVEGDPIDSERYTLLDETLSVENITPEPLCTFDTLTCEQFLKTLRYNLDFSWFIANFPSSSFPQCGLTYSCTRIACLRPLPPGEDGGVRSQKLSCVFKKNQIYFLGTQLTCQDKYTAPFPRNK